MELLAVPDIPRPRPPVVATLVAIGLVALAALAVWRLAGPGSPSGAASGPESGQGSGPGEATVVRVVDGDTVVVEIGGTEETVRLIGIDTPESVAPHRPDECFGAEASAQLAALLPPGTVVRLTRDIEPRDVYDRLLAYVELVADGRHVNLALVADGYAVAKDHPPNTTHRAELEAAERAARGAGLGLWSACGGPDVALAPARGP
jgi:micrococcal nuclease